MIIQDFFKGSPEWNLEILATDISTNILDKATRGIYSNESVATLPLAWQKEYFTKYDTDHMVVADRIKKLITFRRFNLMETRMPFKKKFQVVFCRNVMIYFDNKTRDDLVQRYYNVSEKGAYLFIGHSESLNHATSPYKYLMPATYQK